MIILFWCIMVSQGEQICVKFARILENLYTLWAHNALEKDIINRLLPICDKPYENNMVMQCCTVMYPIQIVSRFSLFKFTWFEVGRSTSLHSIHLGIGAYNVSILWRISSNYHSSFRVWTKKNDTWVIFILQNYKCNSERITKSLHIVLSPSKAAWNLK